MAGIVKKTGSGNSIKQMTKHLQYIGFRSRAITDEKGFFDEKNNKGVSYERFIESIHNNKALKHPRTNKYHKFVFSLCEQEYKNSNRDYKDIIRNTISRYEKAHNIKLNWIGSIHEADKHPHTHIVISGASQKQADGTYKRIYFYKDDFKELKQNFQMEVDRDKLPSLIPELSEGVKMATNMFEQVLKELKRDAERESQEQQKERDRKK